MTHVPSGLATDTLADGLTRDDAVDLAQALARRVPRFPVAGPADYDPELGHITIATVGEFIGEGAVR